MPFWKIYHSTGTFADTASKQSLSQDITNFYTTKTGMPAFYVGVVFIHTPDATFFVGGEARGAHKPFIRLEVEQIHIRLPDEDTAYKQNIEGLCEMLKPHLEQCSWEIHIDETDRRLWAIDGILPPAWKSEEEGRWREAGRPLERL